MKLPERQKNEEQVVQFNAKKTFPLHDKLDKFISLLPIKLGFFFIERKSTDILRGSIKRFSAPPTPFTLVIILL